MSQLKTSEHTIALNKNQFEKLFQLCWGRMYSFAVKTVADEEDAKEIVQDVFKSLWERKDTLQLMDAERYLLRSVKLKSLEHLRNRAIKRRHHEVIQQHRVGYYEEDQMHYNELKSQLNNAVESLPRQCKNVYKMSRDEGLTNKEIAVHLIITERAVEYHISKALSVIKSKLKNYLNPSNTDSY